MNSNLENGTKKIDESKKKQNINSEIEQSNDSKEDAATMEQNYSSSESSEINYTQNLTETETQSDDTPEEVSGKKLGKSKVIKLRQQKDRLEKKLDKKEKELKEQKDKFEFLNAELENTRKHFLKQKQIDAFRTENKILTKFAPLIESFESAIELKQKIAAEHSEQVERFIEGFEQIFKQLKDVFDYYKLKTIDQTEIEFDYRFHEVMMRAIDDNKPEDTVIQILQKGYERDGHVIRPAKVIVSQHTPPPPPPKEEEKEEKVDSKPKEALKNENSKNKDETQQK